MYLTLIELSVRCGAAHTLAVERKRQKLFTCGINNFGQLGAGTREDQRAPAKVAGLEGPPDIVAVGAGFQHSAAMTSAGALVLWGGNNFGQLGQGDLEDRLVPVRLRPPQFGGAPVAMVACGGFHTLVVTQTGRLFAFGYGGHGQLGLNDTNDRQVPVEVGPGRFGGAIIAYAAAGHFHSGVVTAGGAVWTWGIGWHGCLGHNGDQDELVPRELEGQFGGARALSLAAGLMHTMVLTTCGAVWGCGQGADGRLGVGDTADRHVPVLVGDNEAFGQSKVRMVACGTCHNVAVTEEGALWSWGRGTRGRLGHNNSSDMLAPARVGQERFGGAKIVTADCGDGHSAAVSDDGRLFTWGVGCFKNGSPVGLGHEDLADKLVPTKVPIAAKIGFGFGVPLAPELVLAFAMGTHKRLGKAPSSAAGLQSKDCNSVVMTISGVSELICMIIEFCTNSR